MIMGELILAPQVARMISRNAVDDSDVLYLRREVYGDGIVSRQEADGLFALDRAIKDTPESWLHFFVEAVSDYLVEREEPRGYISEANAEWLVSSISTDGQVDTRSELELLVKAIEKADSVPASLAAFALKQVSLAVVDGRGVLARGRMLQRGIIGETEVELLRRILYAAGGAGNIAITREEAEVLFAINDRTIEANNHPAWSELFTKAIACSLMAVSGYAAPSREEALRREEWLNDTSVNLGGFFSRIFSGGLGAYADALRQKSGSESYYAGRNAETGANRASAERVESAEAEWLAERIGRDGVLHKNELQLLAFLKAESPDIHPALKPLLDKVA
jgi:hypothetical protein